MNKQVKKLFGLMALVFALTACGSGSGEKKEEAKEEVKTESQETGKTEEKSKEKPKDELVLGIGHEPEKGFNPIFESSHSSSMIFHSALLKRDVNLHI